MNAAFSKRQWSFSLKLILLTSLLFASHWWIIHNFFATEQFFFPLWQVYVFHFALVFIIFSAVNYRFSNNGGVLNYFLGGSIVKMLFSVLFLLPLLLSDFEFKRPDVYNFFFVYFSLLFFEVFNLSKLLNEEQ